MCVCVFYKLWTILHDWNTICIRKQVNREASQEEELCIIIIIIIYI